MDYRPTFYLPSTFVDGLAEKTTQNKNEIAQFERSITPELAQNMVDISKTYPTLEKDLLFIQLCQVCNLMIPCF